MKTTEEVRQILLEFAYEPEAFNIDILVADVIDLARGKT
jgi:hypothetical protein